MATHAARETGGSAQRYTGVVRATHWIAALCVFALLVTGLEIVASHPRFYWGEDGNIGMTPLFSIPIPSSRATVPTGYGYVLPDQNGWSRYLHFQSAWLLVLTGLLYVIYGLVTAHFWKNVLPGGADLRWHALRDRTAYASRYNAGQRLVYAIVLVVAFPLTIWTGLAMSPGFVSAFPATVTVLGGQQTARTLHFFLTIVLILFVVVHVAMVWRAGFRSRAGAMITGNLRSGDE
ncbi:MAG TPA: cytochrome b/b6 domain-containing protein [Candidatus Limnocylindrales bacterium]|nr:cytochrome b/b6 domain-containing protein [Candidatus Limnocylindrales bacterium]